MTTSDEEDTNNSTIHPSYSSHELPPFLPDQRVFCRDAKRGGNQRGVINDDDWNDGSVYEAIIRQARQDSRSNKWTFRVHYLGWNTRHDRWVDPSIILEDNQSNRQRFEEQQRKQREKEAVQQQEKQQQRLLQQQRRNKVAAVTTNNRSLEDDFAVYCDLPFTLKTLLVEEQEHITRQPLHQNISNATLFSPARNLHHLPATISVRKILIHFKKKKKKEIAAETATMTENAKEKKNTVGQQTKPREMEEKVEQVRCFCQRITRLFNKALPVCLLYPQERPQYNRICRDEALKNTPLVEVYGGEFLLRLVVRLPILMKAISPLSEEILHYGPLLAELIVVLQQNRGACFKGNYRLPRTNELTKAEKQQQSSMLANSNNSRENS